MDATPVEPGQAGCRRRPVVDSLTGPGSFSSTDCPCGFNQPGSLLASSLPPHHSAGLNVKEAPSILGIVFLLPHQRGLSVQPAWLAKGSKKAKKEEIAHTIILPLPDGPQPQFPREAVGGGLSHQFSAFLPYSLPANS